MTHNLIKKIKQQDDARPGIAGERWLAMAGAVAVALWLSTRRHPSIVVGLLGSVASTALVARAATGREVPDRLRRWLPFEQGRRD